MKNVLIAVLFINMFCAALFSQSVKINELMASNSTVIADEDGEYSDWIELYNAGETTVDLSGYGLSDDLDEPFKWTFPSVNIQPYEYKLIFASDKDRRNLPGHWETVIDWGDTWKYLPGTIEPDPAWRAPGFNDDVWLEGPSGFGYGDGDDATTIFPVISLYLRKTFDVSDVNNITHAILNIDFDDGFVAYLNGYEIARENIGTPGTIPGYQDPADTYTEAEIYQGGLPNQYLIENISSMLYDGENLLAIQVHNYSQESSDLTMIPFLTLGMDTLPAESNGVNDLLTGMLPKLHTNFKINSQGETLVLTTPEQVLSDEVFTGVLTTDISKGRQPDGSVEWFFFDESTPGEANSTVGFQSYASEVQFSQAGGFFDAPVTITLTGNESGETIYLTSDGSEPTASSSQYSAPFTVNSTLVIRAKILGDNVLPGPTATHTFFMEESPTLPVVSVSSTPANFWDTDIGIYVMGENAEPNYPYFGANFWEDWERPINIELFEINGNQVLNSGAGVKIFGGWSRGNAQKSLSIFARGRYGNSDFDYQLFSEKPIDEFKSFILRNSGNDWGITMFRDALMTGLVSSVDIDVQAYKPAVVYLNGEYWGIHNIREKVNEDYLAANHPGVDSDNVDELEMDGQVIEGDNEHYNTLINFLENCNPNDPFDYLTIQMLMEVDNFISYQAAQIYFDNTDWPGNNIKFWRPKTPDGRWRWILYDTDFGFGIWNENAYQNNTLAFALEENGPDWPNPPWSTFMLRKLLESNQFKNNFINRLADFMNTIFKADGVNQKINEIQAVLAPEMGRHYTRWGGSVSNWNDNVEVMRNFANNRIPYLRLHIMNEFGLTGLSEVTVDINSDEMGNVQLNTVQPQSVPWSGFYFNDIPITVIAIPKVGYRFTGWTGSVTSTDTEIEVVVDQNVNLTAVFESDVIDDSDIVMNEINYNSADNFNPEDWIELFNKGQYPIDLSSWEFKDEEDMHSFILPENFTLEAGAFTIICRDTLLFKSLFPDVNCIIGQFDFGFSGGGELLRLYNSEGYMIDSLVYNDGFPWPPEADGNGPTLALTDPEADNSLPQNWAASSGHGTPGAENDVLGIENENRKLPEKFGLKQNYPNPFNPETFIEFQLPKNSMVVLEIYDLMGRQIETLIHNNIYAGYHKINWKPAQNLGSGIYFYRINVNGKTNCIKKMVLLK